MIVSGYDLHLYCDGVRCKSGQYGLRSQAEFTHPESGGRARKDARRVGWRLDLKHWTALCPACVKAGNVVAKDAES